MSWSCFSSAALLDLECRKKAIFLLSILSIIIGGGVVNFDPSSLAGIPKHS
jgi:hypothetical protein